MLPSYRKVNYQPLEHLIVRRKLRRDATFPERLLWSRLRSRQLGFKFRRQYSVGSFIVDFCCVEARLVVEVDGDHHGSPGMEEYDLRRDGLLRQSGYEVVHYSTQQVEENLDGVCMGIQEECRKRCKEAPP